MSDARRGASARLIASLAALLTIGSACNSGRDDFDGATVTPPLGDYRDASTDGDACPQGMLRCSRDLRAIVDACDESRIVTECAADQGCADAKCVPACDASVSQGASVGCEFAAIKPAAYNEGGGSCFAAFLANTWGSPVRVEADYGGKALDVASSARIVRSSGTNITYEPFSGELQPDDVLVLFLEQSLQPTIACPAGVTPAMITDSSIRRTARGTSYRIKTSAPVSAYSIYPFGGARSALSSATLLLPVPAWRNDYILTSAWERVVSIASMPTTQIVAAEDDTEVTLVGSVAIQGGPTVEPAEKGVPQTYRLGRGEVLQVVQAGELTGSFLAANKNVGVWAGHECMRIPQDYGACDQSTRQLFPVQSWGRTHVVIPYLSRLPDKSPEEYFHRIVAASDDTVLTYEPAPPPGAPATLSKGGSALFSSFAPFIVKSQDEAHAVAVYSYMSGARYAPSGVDYDGDPEFTSVVPAEQYLDDYVFYVDATYRTSQLLVVRERPEGKDFEPVTLDCAGPLENWTPIGTEGKYEYSRFYLSQYFVPQKVGQGTCDAGRHKIDSRGAFGVTVWGTDYFVSYSYPGGSAIRQLNELTPVVR